MGSREQQAADLFGKVFDRLHDEGGVLSAAEYRRRRFDFAFHMTDWLADLDELHALLADPGQVDAAAAASRLYGALRHLAPHIRAAYRALEGREAADPFLELEAKAREAELRPVKATA